MIKKTLNTKADFYKMPVTEPNNPLKTAKQINISATFTASPILSGLRPGKRNSDMTLC